MFTEKSSLTSIFTKSNNYPYLLASSNNKHPIFDKTSVNGGSVLTKAQSLGYIFIS